MGWHSVDLTPSLLCVFMVMNFRLTTCLVLEINVIPSPPSEFRCTGLRSHLDRLEFLMTLIPSCSRTWDKISPLISFEGLNKFSVENGFQEMLMHADWLKFDSWQARFLFGSHGRQPQLWKMQASLLMSPMSEYFGDGKPVRRLAVRPWAKYCTLSLPLFTQTWKWVLVKVMLEAALQWTSIQSRGVNKYFHLICGVKPKKTTGLMSLWARTQTSLISLVIPKIPLYSHDFCRNY